MTHNRPRSPVTRPLHVLAACVLACAAAWADPYAPNLGEPGLTFSSELLRPLDQGVDDIGPLGASLRHFERDYRLPIDFEDVYAVPGRPGERMRAHGALRAVFPRSEYFLIDDLQFPVVPAGTVFYIGDPQAPWETQRAAAPEAGAPSARISNRISLRLDDHAFDRRRSDASTPREAAPMHERRPDVEPAEAQEPRRPTMWSDESYRRSRLEALLSRAAGERR